jgi:hypothetical protein
LHPLVPTAAYATTEISCRPPLRSRGQAATRYA